MSKILGMGHCLPGPPVTNAEVARALGSKANTDGLLGGASVRSRHYAPDGQGPSDLAKPAAEAALQEAGLEPRDVDFLIFATMTPDVTFPGAGCFLQHKLGCDTIGALDLRAQCAGFIFALDVAEQFIRAGAYERVLIAAGDVHSTGLDFSPGGESTTPLFGDGAAALLLGSEGDGLVEVVIHTDASELERFWCEFPSSRRRPTRILEEDIRLGRHYPKIDAEFVKRDGGERIHGAVDEVLSNSGVRAQQVRRFFLQHVYRDAAITAARSLGVTDRSTIGGLDDGHIASASLAISLSRARSAGEVHDGDLVCLATAGAGMNSAAALLRL